ncbi:MAG: hypothetical protein ACSHWZ_19200 [Sulfitobacter sp.]
MNVAITTAFLAIFQLVQANVEGAEVNSVEIDPPIAAAEEAQDTGAGQMAVALLTCNVFVDEKETRRDITVLATAGESPINDKLFFKINLQGANEQTMRRSKTVDINAGETAALANYIITMPGKVDMTAAVELGEDTFPCMIQ